MKKKLFKAIFIAILAIIATLVVFFCNIIVPVMAITYHDIYRDFRDYEVANFNDVPIVLNAETFNNNVYGWSSVNVGVSFSSCPAATKRFIIRTELVAAGVSLYQKDKTVDIPCVTGLPSNYLYESLFDTMTSAQKQAIKTYITTDDNTSIDVYTELVVNPTDVVWNGVVATLYSLEATTTFYYEFNTAYYFDHIAIDSSISYFQVTSGGSISNVPGESDCKTYLLVAYSSNDYYRITNSDYSYSTTRGRKKYNVDIGEHIVSYGIGAGSMAIAPFVSGSVTLSNTTPRTIYFLSKIYLLNYSNTQQSFPGTSMPNLEYQTCNAWDIPCHLGNALTYIALDLPITSDIYGLFSKGFRLVSDGLYAITGIFGANFDNDGLISGNFFSITLVISLGVLIVIQMVEGGDNDDE